MSLNQSPPKMEPNSDLGRGNCQTVSSRMSRRKDRTLANLGEWTSEQLSSLTEIPPNGILGPALSALTSVCCQCAGMRSAGPLRLTRANTRGLTLCLDAPFLFP